eukprot:m.33932 g.33932  ORF g.33932 m.33932 type:complete len:796 (-) comp5085_c0_seq1:109-2496(-)
MPHRLRSPLIGVTRIPSPMPEVFSGPRRRRGHLVAIGILVVGMAPVSMWLMSGDHLSAQQVTKVPPGMHRMADVSTPPSESVPLRDGGKTASDLAQQEGRMLRNKLARLSAAAQASNSNGDAQAAAAVQKRLSRWCIHVVVLSHHGVNEVRHLYTQLARVRYAKDEDVYLSIHVGADRSKDIHDYMETVQWPHGPLDVRVRHSTVGENVALLESWYPSGGDQWAVMLHTGVSVDPSYIAWAEEGRVLCDSDPVCIGIGLHALLGGANETARGPGRQHARVGGEDRAYLAQVPSRLGAVYKPGPWRMFRQWAEHQSAGPYDGELDLGDAASWTPVWRRWLLELMLIMDWFVLHPQLPSGHPGYVTEQDHAADVADTDAHARSEGRLVLNPNDQDNDLARLDHRLEPIKTVAEALLASTRTPRTLSSYRQRPCDVFNPEAHTQLLQPGLTVVVGHYYSRSRFDSFLHNVLTFCTYPEIKRIVVVWNFPRLTPPTMGLCSNSSTAHQTTTVHFVIPTVEDTISNRFIPTYRIRTDAVITVDDDMMASRRDLQRMEAVLRANDLQRVVGPYPRWYDGNGRYRWLPTMAKYVGYPIILTKLHVSPTHLYQAYYCDGNYNEQRKLVDASFNGEDILYMRVAASRGVKPLYIVTLDPLIDSGLNGLHNKSGHTRERSAIVRACKFEANMWSKDVVLPPGTALTQYKHTDYTDVYENKTVECHGCHAAGVKANPLNGHTIEVPDPLCTSGLAFESTCCVLECTQCGGERCDRRRPGPNGCCGGVIKATNLSCKDHQPPCVLER